MENSSTTIVIFGATGDLTARKLIPALFSSFRKGRLPQNFRIVGFARRPWSHGDFRAQLYEGMKAYAAKELNEEKWAAFVEHLWFVQGNLDTAVDFDRLQTSLVELEQGHANRLYYLATSPEYFVPIVQNLGSAHMATEEEGWRRVVVEKPFGTDLQSARALSDDLHAVFREKQIYRIDHYLGKETAQNILFLRFANIIFEPIWNRNYVNNVQISVLESVDVGRRAGYYDKSGVIRDMFQNHLLQLLTLVAMEPPSSFDADAVRNEKTKLFKAIRPIPLTDTVRGQYEGYQQAEGVAPNSQTPTFAALKLYIDNWRWKGVPFYLRSGKGLAQKSSEIIIEFQKPPHLMFDKVEDADFKPNILSLCIQPDEGIHLTFEAKVPDSPQEQETRSVVLGFHYESSFKGKALPDAYERLLLDAMNGDATLFTRSDSIDVAWELMDPILAGWVKTPEVSPLVTYKPGSMGPTEADELLGRNGRLWRHDCGEHEG